MHTPFMSMNIVRLTRLLILQMALLSYSYAEEQEGTRGLNQFALSLKEAIVNRDVDSFKAVDCFPVSCIGSEEVLYVFGAADDAGVIRQQFLDKDIRIKIFGPYTYEDRYENKSYSLVFYDSSRVHFKDDGTMDISDRERFWENGYVETVVIFNRDKKKWQFHGTPFYYGTHLPWAEDYG